MIHAISARIGTSEAARRVDARALAFQGQKAEAARHEAEAERERRRASREAAEAAKPVRTARQWAEDQVAAWAARQPHIVVRTFKPRWRTIMEEVAARHDVSIEDLLGSSRVVILVRPRQEAMYRIYDETAFSFLEIGRRFGRDHSTVLHGIRAHAGRHGLPMPRRDEEDPS